jgi:hypothetical protein
LEIELCFHLDLPVPRPDSVIIFWAVTSQNKRYHYLS